MSLSDAVSAAVAAFRRRPSDLLPWYLLGAAVPAIARTIPFLVVALWVAYLEVTGRLATVRDELAGLDTEPPDPEADPEAFESWLAEFEPIAEQLFTPGLFVLVVLTLLVTVVLGIAMYAFTAAGQLTACSARQRGNRGITAGIAGARRYWLRFIGLYLLELLAWIAVVFAVGMAVGLLGGLLAAATGSEAVALFVGFAMVLAIGLSLAAVRAVFAFAPVAVVVDDTTAISGVSNTLSFVRSRPLQAGFYYVVVLLTMVTISILSWLLLRVDVVAFVSLMTALLVLPALDLLKTALYNDYRERLAPPAAPERSLLGQLRDGLGRGLREMLSFVRETPGTHALVVALAFGSFWVGWEIAEPLVGAGVETSISARLEGHVAPAAALEFFGNNWMVAITTALSGVALAIPAIISLVFNGFVMGVYGRTEVEPMELLAFVVPHGVFEIPAIFIASALGIWLGVVGWRAYRGQTSRAAFADALERAFWVLIGIGILLAIAGFVEGFVSPYYYDLLL